MVYVPPSCRASSLPLIFFVLATPNILHTLNRQLQSVLTRPWVLSFMIFNLIFIFLVRFPVHLSPSRRSPTVSSSFPYSHPHPVRRMDRPRWWLSAVLTVAHVPLR
ncbi:hypothetical protein DFH08DRAFT_851083 [Mycena albidolilacea]|uniref:Uncharacterized protein n=1 Tax=Mycena albidolilacea TaxID=1033008 RepID=A0AAD7AFE3_9AGAR|nr:hypothetical protein DFH08DRAFT_851083 [Mycena albidolilacea]